MDANGPSIPSMMAQFRILSRLGAGGMGEVYLAEDTRLDRKVAIKVLPGDVVSDPERLKRFVREAKAASALNHPNVAQIYEINDSGGIPFISMEYVQGDSLQKKIETGEVETSDILEIGIQIADALQEAHQKGIVHRDIKPANILINTRNQVKVLDFGLARITIPGGVQDSSGISTQTATESGMIMGTVPYMSPEQALGRKVDGRSDIFSLGTLLYQLCTRRLPFAGQNPAETFHQIMSLNPTPISQVSRRPQELERIIGKCLEKKEDERYQTAQDLLIDLKRLKRGSESGVITPATMVRNRSSWNIWIFGATAVLLSFAVILWMGRSQTNETRSIHSIAVLPFENTGKNPELEYLTDGITETLINTLSKSPQIKVIARSSVFRYKGQSVDPARAAKELNVETVLTGRITQYGNNLSVSAELMDAENNSQIWGESYNRGISNLFALQKELAETISGQLSLNLTPEQKTQKPAPDAEAYNLYLQGMYQWNKATEDGARKAIAFFERSIDRDPTFALAYAGLGNCYGIFLGEIFLSPAESFPKARSAAQKALQLDSTLAEPHTVLAVILMAYDRDWHGAEVEYRRAIELNPGYAFAHHQYAWFLSWTGRLEEAANEFDRAYQLDPLSLVIAVDRCITYFYKEDYSGAQKIGLKVIEMDPRFFLAHFVAGISTMAMGDNVKALEYLHKAYELEPAPFTQSMLGCAYARQGKQKEAIGILEDLEQQSKERWVSRYYYALLSASLGRNDEALTWLERAFDDRDFWLVWLQEEPVLNSLHSDPRFQDLVRRMNFPRIK